MLMISWAISVPLPHTGSKLRPGARILQGLLPALEGKPAELWAKSIVCALAPAALLYTLGLRAYLMLYTLGWRQRAQLPSCVVSIGNLTSGGTGKTGLTIALGRALLAGGYRVAVLSRGYRSRSERSVTTVSTSSGLVADVQDAGDEPYLIAQSLPGATVIVGKDRRQTGRLAIEIAKPDVVLLDDGMQYYQLHRDVEIVLLSASRPFGNGRALPAGVLREPVDHIKRASCVVVTGQDDERRSADLSRVPRSMPTTRARYVTRRLMDVRNGGTVPLSTLVGQRVGTLCGLGDPESFERTVAGLGAQIVHSVRLSDHVAPSRSQLEDMQVHGKRDGLTAIVISAKDAVKLPEPSGFLPIWALDAELVVDDMAMLLGLIDRAVRSRHP